MQHNLQSICAGPAGAHGGTARPLRRAPRKIAIIGGMGPDAGVDLVSKFLLACRARLKSQGLPVDDQHYPPHLLVQHPIPDRSLALIQRGPDPLDDILDACRIAIDAGATTLGIACNTAHLWYPQIASASAPATVLHMADVAALAIAAAGFRQTALMATTATCRSGLYHDALGRHGIDVVEMNDAEHAIIQSAIFEGVKAGDFALAQRLATEVAQPLLDRVDSILLACTELPIALRHFVPDRPQRVIDAGAALAAALADAAFAQHDSVNR